jgi:hypothetical protein
MCDNAIRGTPVRLESPGGQSKDFCTTYCLEKHQKKEAQRAQVIEGKRGMQKNKTKYLKVNSNWCRKNSR